MTADGPLHKENMLRLDLDTQRLPATPQFSSIFREETVHCFNLRQNLLKALASNVECQLLFGADVNDTNAQGLDRMLASRG